MVNQLQLPASLPAPIGLVPVERMVNGWHMNATLAFAWLIDPVALDHGSHGTRPRVARKGEALGVAGDHWLPRRKVVGGLTPPRGEPGQMG